MSRRIGLSVTVVVLVVGAGIPARLAGAQGKTTEEQITATREACHANRHKPEMWAQIQAHCERIDNSLANIEQHCAVLRTVRSPAYQRKCEELTRRSPDSRNAGWESAHQRELERQKTYTTPCQQQWGENRLMVEYCEQRARGTLPATAAAAPPREELRIELERARRVEKQAHVNLLEGKARQATAAAELAESGAVDGARQAAGIYAGQIAEFTRDYQEARRRRLEVEAQWRATYGEPPRAP